MASTNLSVAAPPDPGTLASLLTKLGAKPSTVNWAYAVLAQGGWPQTPSNVNFLQAWAAAEGGSFNNDYTYNVLNTGQSGYGGVVPAGGSFPAFPSWSDGVQATVATLNQTNGDYANITDALATGNATQQFTQGNLDSAITTWDPGASGPGGDLTIMRENIGAPPVLISTGTTTGGVPALTSTAAGTPSSTATSSILGNCDPSTNYINVGFLGSFLSQCNVKAMVSGGFIGVGAVLVLIGLFMTFDRGKGLLGKAAGGIGEAAGAALTLVPGAELVGAGVAAMGHTVSKKAGSKRAAPRPRQRAAAPSSGDDLARAHAEGFHKGQTAGPNSGRPPGRNIPADAGGPDDF